MVNLVKARQKAKKNREEGAGRREETKPADNRHPTTVNSDKLERFKAAAGEHRAKVVQIEEAPATDQLDLLTFVIGGEQYAIEVERVIEITTPRPLTRVPNAGAFIRGVMSLRGVVVTMVDIRARLRHPRSGEGEQVIVVTDRGAAIGFDVDRVLRPVKVAREAVEPHPVVDPSEERPAIRGVVRDRTALTIILDLEKLLS